jgi:flagellar secretion chaperone FliS
MYPSNSFGANAYARVGLETGVNGASPHGLITLLFQGARRAITLGRMHMENKDFMAKGKALSHATLIIGGGLQQSLNLEKGGDLAAQLNTLYDYMTRRLLEANLHNDPAILLEVDGLLATIEEGWNAINPQLVQQNAGPNVQVPASAAA